MASKFQAAGLGTDALFTSGFRLTVRGGLPSTSPSVIRVNPADLELAKKAFLRSIIDKPLKSTGTAMLFGSAASTLFQAIVITGLVAGRGPRAANSEFLERVLPPTPARLLYQAQSLKSRVLLNTELIQAHLTDSVSRSGPAAHRLSAAHRSSAAHHSSDSPGGGGSESGSGSESGFFTRVWESISDFWR